MARFKALGYYIVFKGAISVDLELEGTFIYHHIHIPREQSETDEHLVLSAKRAAECWAEQRDATLELFKDVGPKEDALTLTPSQIETIFRAGVSAGESSSASYHAGGSMHGSILDYLENALVWDNLLPEFKDMSYDAKVLWWSIFKTAMGRDS